MLALCANKNGSPNYQFFKLVPPSFRAQNEKYFPLHVYQFWVNCPPTTLIQDHTSIRATRVMSKPFWSHFFGLLRKEPLIDSKLNFQYWFTVRCLHCIKNSFIPLFQQDFIVWWLVRSPHTLAIRVRFPTPTFWIK